MAVAIRFEVVRFKVHAYAHYSLGYLGGGGGGHAPPENEFRGYEIASETIFEPM